MSMTLIGIEMNSSVPARTSEGAAAYDFAADEEKNLAPGSVTRIDLNLKLAIPDGVYLQLHSRSGLALQGVVTVGGVIDSDYRGPICAILHNFSANNVLIKKGQLITSGVFLPTMKVQFQPENILPSTVRGSSGFGSSD